jgi:hypothetical protein
MSEVETMLHMDPDYSWRWYVTKNGKLICMSTSSFFTCEEARQDYDDMLGQLKLVA